MLFFRTFILELFVMQYSSKPLIPFLLTRLSLVLFNVIDEVNKQLLLKYWSENNYSNPFVKIISFTKTVSFGCTLLTTYCQSSTPVLLVSACLVVDLMLTKLSVHS